MNYDICQCQCHKYPEMLIKHLAPCCITCPHCKLNIHAFAYDKHIADHNIRSIQEIDLSNKRPKKPM